MPPETVPSLDEFAKEVKPLNPSVTDQQIAEQYRTRFPSSAPLANAPTLDDFLKEVKPLNPDRTDDELKTKWQEQFPGAPEHAPTFLSTAKRGFDVGMGQLLPTAKGAVGLLGATAEQGLGEGGIATRVKEWGLQGFKEGMEKLAPLQHETDSPTEAWKKATEQGDMSALTDLVAYGLGYGASQLAQSAAVGLAGAAIGTVVGGPAGTAPGAIAGMVEQAATKGLIKSWVEKAIAKRVAQGMTEQAAVKSIGRDMGALGAMGTFATSQEMGQIYPAAEEQAAKEGRKLDGADIARAWGASAVAGASELIPEAYIFGKAIGRFASGAGSRLARAGASAVTGGALEAGQEAFQTAVEHAGAGQPIADEAGTKDIVDSAVLALIPGLVGGGGAGLISPNPQPVKTLKDILDAKSTDEAITHAQNIVGQPAVTPEGLDAFIGTTTDVGTKIKDAATIAQETEADRADLLRNLKYFNGQTKKNPLTTDEQGNAFFDGAPVDVVHPSTLPKTTALHEGMSQDKFEVLNDIANLFGKRIVMYESRDTLPDGFVNRESDPSLIFMAKDTAGADVFSVFAHEATHHMQGTPFYDALKDAVWSLRTPAAKELLIARHGRLSQPRLVNEMVSDISGTELHKPEVWEKVYKNLQERYGPETAKSEVLGFIDTIKEMIAKVKNLIATRPWATGFGQSKKTMAEQYVTDLTKLHDALAAGVANAIYTTREKTQKGQATKGKMALSQKSATGREIVHPEAVLHFTNLAKAQRGAPETAMLNVQRAVGGGVLNPVVENVGDLIHRMTEAAAYGMPQKEILSQKIERSINALTHAYGFEKEHHENLSNNARYDKRPVAEVRAAVDAALLNYTKEHQKLPTYNLPQWLANQAAIAVGEKRFDDAVAHLKELQKLVKSKDFGTQAFAFNKGEIYKKAIPTKLIGIQRGNLNIPDIELHNLETALPGHPAGSTVSRETIEQAGYRPQPTDVISKAESVEHRKLLKKGEQSEKVTNKTEKVTNKTEKVTNKTEKVVTSAQVPTKSVEPDTEGKAKEDYDYASTQIDLPAPLAKKVLAIGEQIKTEDLAEKGREDNPHITVKYGLHSEDPTQARALLSRLPPVTATIGDLTFFETDDGDVIVLKVESPQLVEMNKTLTDNLENTTDFAYTPHITVAYVKPGLGKQYVESLRNTLKSNIITADTISFSDKKGEKTPIKLGEPPANERRIEFSTKKAMIGVTQAELPPEAKVPKVQWDKDELRANAEFIKDDWSGVKSWGRGQPTVYQSYVPKDEVPHARTPEINGVYDWSEYKKTNTFPPITIVIHENGVARKLEDGNHRARFWREKGFDYFPAWIVDFRKGKIETEKVKTSVIQKANISVTSKTHEESPYFSPRVWFSTLGNTLAAKMPAKASKEQVLNILKGPGVKEDEVKWTGIRDYLDAQKGPIDKHNLLAWLAANDVQVKEVVKRQGISHLAGGGAYEEGYVPTLQQFVHDWNQTGRDPSSGEDTWTHQDFPNVKIRNTIGTDYYHVQIGDKFLESDGTLADEYTSTNAFNSFNAATEAAYEHLVAEPERQMHEADSRNETQYEGYKLPGGTDYTELLLTLPKQPSSPVETREGTGDRNNFISPHFDEPNILAHVRFDTRQDVEGKNVLFLEEVQSDWHEQGREKGYVDPTLAKEKESVEQAIRDVAPAIDRDRSHWNLVLLRNLAIPQDLQDRWYDAFIRPSTDPVPEAPFKHTWPELVMKRMLRWAAEHNYDRLAWTTGAQQNERYGLSKHIDKLIVYKDPNRDTYWIRGIKDGNDIVSKRDLTVETLPGVIGQDVTDRALEKLQDPTQRLGDSVTLTGLDLEVGGSGMKYFYDQMLPKFMEKYLKRFGTKVETIKIPTSAGPTSNPKNMFHVDTESVHSIPLTQEMKDSVINEGQPLFSPARNVQPTYAIEPPGKLDRLIRVLQNKNIDIQRVVEAIRQTGTIVPEPLNPVLAEEMYQKRDEQRAKDYTNDELRPLTELMRLAKVTLSQLDDYLHARHVITDNVNARLEAMNPTLPNNKALSGMTDAEAKKILAAAPAVMPSLAKHVDDMIETTRQMMVDYGLEKQSTIDRWRQQYQAYVPLHREGFEEGGFPTGTGRSVRGSTVKQRGGSNLAVENILANVAQERDQIITRGEKQRPVIAMAGLMMIAPNAAFATLDKPSTITYTDPATGLPVTVPGNLANYEVPTVRRFDPVFGTMKTYPDPAYKGRDNVVNFRIKGIDYAIVFNERDVRAMEVAKAFKNLGTAPLSGIMKAIAPYTRYLAAINTQYNPIFGIVNFVRDAQFAMLTLADTPLAGKRLEVLNNARKSLAGIYQDARSVRSGSQANSPIARLWQRFEHVGGPTGYRDLFFTSTERAKEIERLLDPKSWTGIRNPQDLGKRLEETPMFQLLSDYNLTMENSIRLGVFKTAVDMGISDLQAASYAKNITVNFNKKGQIGAQMGSLYAFFNANVQGTARIAETLFERTPNGFRLSSVGKKIVVGGILSGVLQTFMLAMAGFDDGDPPEFVKEKNFVIPIPGTEKGYTMVPMPLGFNLLPNVGRLASEMVANAIKGRPSKPLEKGADLFATMYNALSPVGGSGGIAQEVSPTVLDPITSLTMNKDWTGKPIYKEDISHLDPTPGHARAHDTATAWAKGLSYMINWATGGTEYVPGILSPTPDAIDFLIQQATGGVGREVSKAAQVVNSLRTGEELPTHKIPLVGRFAGSATGAGSVRAKFYENVLEANKAYNEFEGRAKHHESFTEYVKTHPEARFSKVAVVIEKDINLLRQQKADMIAKGASRDSVRLQEDRITGLMKRYNDLIENAQK